MFRTPRQSDLQTRLILCLACLAVGLSNSYLPLPVAAVRDFSVPFPCQNSVCGCRNAAQCWSSCCCHTDLQKLTWAQKNSVTPPDSFLQKIAAKKLVSLNSKAQLAVAATTQVHPACCCGKSKMSNSSANDSSACCQSRNRRQHSKDLAQSNEDTNRSVVIQALRRCQGIVGNFFTVALKLLPPQDSTFVVLSQAQQICWLAPPGAMPPSQSPDPMPD